VALRERSAAGERARQHRTDDLLDRLRQQFPELSADDLARAAVGVQPLPDLHRREVVEPQVRRDPPRHRA
jgi:hypothetical protein